MDATATMIFGAQRKRFGYLSNDPEAELPTELREDLSADEIELVIAFLRNAKLQFEACSPTPGQSGESLAKTLGTNGNWTTTYPDEAARFTKTAPTRTTAITPPGPPARGSRPPGVNYDPDTGNFGIVKPASGR